MANLYAQLARWKVSNADEFMCYVHSLDPLEISNSFWQGNELTATTSLHAAQKAWLNLQQVLIYLYLNQRHRIMQLREKNWAGQAAKVASENLEALSLWRQATSKKSGQMQQAFEEMIVAFRRARLQIVAPQRITENRLEVELRETFGFIGGLRAAELDFEYAQMRETNIRVLLEYAEQAELIAANLPQFTPPPKCIDYAPSRRKDVPRRGVTLTQPPTGVPSEIAECTIS